MPVHNGERFVREAIDSMLAQTFGDFELIVVDDGSSDATPDILRDIAARDARVRIHRLDPNRGVTGALNEGCRLARAPLIARMDADDISLPRRLEAQVAYLRSHAHVSVVGSWVQLIDDRGTNGALKTYPSDPAMVAWSLAFFNTLAHPTVMMRRDALEMPAVYSEEYPRAEDYALFTQLSRTTQLANLPEVLLRYRMWSGNSSRNPEQERQAARVVSDHARALGVHVSTDVASGLQGLARDRYPAAPDQIRDVARAIGDLHTALVPRLTAAGLSPTSASEDAAVRLWLLSALAARRSPVLAASLAAKAFGLRPASIVTFVKKVVWRVTGR
jgi:glycosyltransferase involved in cell wall biosynthesis